MMVWPTCVLFARYVIIASKSRMGLPSIAVMMSPPVCTGAPRTRVCLLPPLSPAWSAGPFGRHGRNQHAVIHRQFERRRQLGDGKVVVH